MANRFTTAGMFALEAVSFYASGWAEGDEVDVALYEDPTGEAPWPDPLMEVWSTTAVLEGGGFQEVPAGHIMINPGGTPGAAFFVAVTNRAGRSYKLGVDRTGPYGGSTYVSTDGGLTFEPLSSIPIIDGNAMIRAFGVQGESCFIEQANR